MGLHSPSMRCLLFLLVLVSLSWCTTFTQYPITDTYVVDNRGLFTLQYGRIQVPVLDRLNDPREILQVKANLNGGAIGVIFAESETKSLRWNVDSTIVTKGGPIKEYLYAEPHKEEPKKEEPRKEEGFGVSLAVQLCLDSERKSCYNSRELTGTYSSDVNIQVEVSTSGSYLRFKITIDDGDQTGLDPVELYQVLRQEDYVVTGDWVLELEQRDSRRVTLAQVAVAVPQTQTQDVVLWSSCLDDESFISLYQKITGTTNNPDMTKYRPSACTDLPTPTVWGAKTSDCTLTGSSDTEFYQFSCPKNTGSTAGGGPIPSFCFYDVYGDFEFTIQADSIVNVGRATGYLGVFAVPESNSQGDHFGGWTTLDRASWRYKEGASQQQVGSAPQRGQGIPPVDLRLKRSGDTFSFAL